MKKSLDPCSTSVVLASIVARINPPYIYSRATQTNSLMHWNDLGVLGFRSILRIEQSSSSSSSRSSSIRGCRVWNKKLMPVCRECRCYILCEGKTKAVAVGKGVTLYSKSIYVYRYIHECRMQRVPHQRQKTWARGNIYMHIYTLSPSLFSFFLSPACLRTI